MDVDVKKNLEVFQLQVNKQSVQLVAVSKTKPASLVMQAYEAGQRDFGENKVQEMVEKYEQLPKDIRWHQIGHLQTNKVKYIAPFVHLIHSVDSLKLLHTIQKEAARHNRTINCLLQIHIAEEETKFGLSDEEASAIISEVTLNSLPNIRIVGLMGMATFTEEEGQIRREFKHLKNLFESMKAEAKTHGAEMTVLSMGMSGDYKIAIEEGSTMVRVGSAIFGERNYTT